ncbi:hypothetical protein TSAR_016724 [Trichomalopsis sarcophagae]|uniref:Uncharacterized protein n=1 Tax=Trichomalopsis sarcophagae TaxID=543379 RepID=A0A232EFY7_9HYME|nr:hypothetical protein TSAR_016724 [Trichomalopsis sarcophagae]
MTLKKLQDLVVGNIIGWKYVNYFGFDLRSIVVFWLRIGARKESVL